MGYTLDGQEITTFNTVEAAEVRARNAKALRVEVKVLEDGNEKVASASGGGLGFKFCDYPFPLIHYFHSGHRGVAWDETVSRGLKMRSEEYGPEAAKVLINALEKGCRDPAVLQEAIRGFLEDSQPEEALKIWQAWSGQIKRSLYKGNRYRLAMMRIGMAKLYTGDLDGAIAHFDETIGLYQKEAPGDSEVNSSIAWRALATCYKDVDRGIPLLQQAINKIEEGEDKNFWIYNLLPFLKRQGKWDEVARYKGILEAGKKPLPFAPAIAFKFLAELPAARGVKMPEHWALVFRNNFEVPKAVRWTNHEVFDSKIEPSAGKLRFSVDDSWGCYFTWYFYPCAVRVDVKGALTSYDPLTGGRYRGVGVCALMAPLSMTEVGCRIQFPRDFQGLLVFENIGLGYRCPWLDTRKQHLFSTRCLNGRVEYYIDERYADVQLVPPQSGMCGVRAGDAVADFDDFEIFLPSDKPVDNEAIRKRYDGAAAAWNQGDRTTAFAALEEAAVLQQQDCRELGRLYAAYVRSEAQSLDDALKTLESRFALVAERKALDMLLIAEQQLQLMFLDYERYRSALGLHYANSEGRRELVARGAFSRLKAKGGCGELAIYAQWEAERPGVKSETAAQVYEDLIRLDLKSLTHKYKLLNVLLKLKETAKAKALVEELQKRLPKAVFLAAMLETEGPKAEKK